MGRARSASLSVRAGAGKGACWAEPPSISVCCTLPRPSITPQQLGAQLLPGLLWMWPTSGEGCGPGSPAPRFFLLLEVGPVAVCMLGKCAVSEFSLPFSLLVQTVVIPLEQGHGFCSIQKEELVSPVAPHPGSFSDSGSSRTPVCAGVGSSPTKESITRPEFPDILRPPGPRSSGFAPGWSR